MTTTFVNAVVLTLIIIGITFLLCATLYCIAIIVMIPLGWLRSVVTGIWRAARPRHQTATVLPMVRKRRNDTQPRGAA